MNSSVVFTKRDKTKQLGYLNEIWKILNCQKIKVVFQNYICTSNSINQYQFTQIIWNSKYSFFTFFPFIFSQRKKREVDGQVARLANKTHKKLYFSLLTAVRQETCMNPARKLQIYSFSLNVHQTLTLACSPFTLSIQSSRWKL